MKPLIILGFFGLLLVASLRVVGQETSTTLAREITVYLKNGKYVYGRESLSAFRGYMTVDTDYFSQKHIPYKKIAYIHYGPPLPKPVIPLWGSKPNFFISILTGVQFGNVKEGDNRASASVIVGYSWNPLLQPSVGIGYMQYDPFSTTTFLARLHGVLPDRKWSPMYFIEAGTSQLKTKHYDFNVVYHDTQGGFMVHPGVGIQRRFLYGAISLQAGYRIQRAKLHYSVPDFWGGTLQAQENITYRRISTTLGFTF